MRSHCTSHRLPSPDKGRASTAAGGARQGRAAVGKSGVGFEADVPFVFQSAIRNPQSAIVRLAFVVLVICLVGRAHAGIIPFSHDRLVLDTTMNHLPRCICPGPSERNLLGLERPNPQALGKWTVGAPQATLRVLGIRVEFPFEETDDPTTTGRGRFDLRDTTAFFDSAGHNFDSSPHNRRYFETHLRALDQYWNVVSNGKISLERAVYPIAEDSAYRVPQSTAFYGHQRDGDSGLVFGLRQFIHDAATAASADPAIRFADYDAVIFFHAGTSRQFDVLNDSPNDLFSVFVSRDDPVILRDGADTLGEAIIIPETASQDGRISVLNGVIAHEFGHQLGLVDLYSTFNFATQVGNFSLMDNNANDVGIETVVNDQTRILFGAVPVFPDAWSRAYLGFVDVLTVTDSTPVIVWAAEEVETAPQNRQVWRVPISSTEYYLLENRQFDLDGNEASGLKLDTVTSVVLGPAHPVSRQFTREYDFLLPGSGMLIWHVDEGVASLDYATGDEIENNFLANTLQWDHDRRFVSIVEADGYNRLGSTGFYFFYTGGPTTYWKAGVNTSFTPTSVPPSLSFTGGHSGVSITNVSASSVQMTCKVARSRRLAGFPVYVGPDDNDRAAPVITDVLRFETGDFRAPGDGQPEVFVGYKHFILAFDSEGRPLTNHPVEDTLRSFDTTDVVHTFYPVAMGLPGETWISPPLIHSIDGQTGTLAAVSSAGHVGIWHMADRDLDGLFDPIVDTVLSTSDLPSGPPLIWDRPNSTSTKDLFVPVGEAGYDLFSLLSGDRNAHTYEGYIGYVAGRGPDRSYSIDSLNGNWTAGEFVGSGGGTRAVLGPERPFAPVLGNIDHELDIDAVILERNGLLHVASAFAVPGDGIEPVFGFTQQLGFRPAAGPILADLDGDGRLEIIVAGEGQITAIAHNGVVVSDFPVTIGDRNDPDTNVGGILAVDLGTDMLSTLTGGEGRATLAYRQGKDVPSTNYAVGGEITVPMALATNAVSSQNVIYARADDGFLYAFIVPNSSSAPATAVWPMAGHDARNTHAIPNEDLNPVDPDDVFFTAERAYVYPNPANGEAVVRYWLGADATVSINIYDIAGNLITEAQGPGVGGAFNEWTWSCADVASGVYYARVEVTAVDGGQSEKIFCKLAVVQ